VVDGSLDLAARATVLQAFLFDKATIGAAKKFALQRQMNRARDACAVGCHSARFFAAILWCRDLSSTGRDSSSHRTEHFFFVKDFCYGDLKWCL
jgi:hypothetical protein